MLDGKRPESRNRLGLLHLRQAVQAQCDRRPDLLEVETLVQLERHGVVLIYLQDGPLAAGRFDMLQRLAHEQAGNAAPAVLGSDRHVGDLPARAVLVGALHRDVARHAALIHPDEPAEDVVVNSPRPVQQRAGR